MKLLFAFCFSLTLVLSVFSTNNENDHKIWKAYKNKYGKMYYSPVEDVKRRAIFFNNKEKVDEHNELFDQGVTTYKMDLNKFADYTIEEVLSLTEYIGGFEKLHAETYVPMKTETPKIVDWRDKGAVTDVKDQGLCKSCFAFSATGSMEGQHFLKYGELVSLSDQNLVDCTPEAGNKGCKGGGSVDYAFQYVIDNGGIATEASYPYLGKVSDECHYSNKSIGAKFTGFKYIQSGSESDLENAVANIGPISVAIDANIVEGFHLYSSGIFNSRFCSTTRLNHAVLVVGYGSENGSEYWLVKNSWGAPWGDKGYVKIAKNKNNACGIATRASYPTV